MGGIALALQSQRSSCLGPVRASWLRSEGDRRAISFYGVRQFCNIRKDEPTLHEPGPMNPASSPFVGRVLLVSNDEVAIEQLTESMQWFALFAERCPEVSSALERLNRTKFEGVVVDLRLGSQAGAVLEGVRHSPANKHAVVFTLIITARDRFRTTAIRSLGFESLAIFMRRYYRELCSAFSFSSRRSCVSFPVSWLHPKHHRSLRSPLSELEG